MKIKLAKKVISGLVIGCLSLSFGTLALAHDRQEGPPPRDDFAIPTDRPNPADREHHISSKLDKLVSENLITRDQADKLLNFFKQKDSQREAERKADMDKMKDMSPDERHTYLEQKFSFHPDFITELKGIADLSDEQAKDVADAIRPPHGPRPGGPGCQCPMLPNP
ncbi:MAG TPA: hypothetical protein VGL27_06865 [Negativicutes bacterium]|jgi:hypothetical protein